VLGLGLFFSEVVDGDFCGIFCSHLTSDVTRHGKLCPGTARVV
jgi:hypothetical protein